MYIFALYNYNTYTSVIYFIKDHHKICDDQQTIGT